MALRNVEKLEPCSLRSPWCVTPLGMRSLERGDERNPGAGLRENLDRDEVRWGDGVFWGKIWF